MTFKDFVSVLCDSKCFNGKLSLIGKNLFVSARPNFGVKGEISEDAIISWLNGRKKPRIATYFPEGILLESNQNGLRDFFHRRTSTPDAWHNLQNDFLSWKENNPDDKDFCVNLKTDNQEDFYASLINQFCLIFHLPIVEPKEPIVHQQELSSERIRDDFTKVISDFQIMDIINKDPPVYNRNDAATLNVFVNSARTFLGEEHPLLDHTIKSHMNNFIDQLELHVMSIDASLNRESTLEWVNMESDPDEEIKDSGIECAYDDDNEDSIVLKAIYDFFFELGHKLTPEEDEHIFDADELEDMKDLIIDFAHELEKYDEDETDDTIIEPTPELDWELIASSANPTATYKLSLDTWDKFRREMNEMYDYICSWEESSSTN